MSISVLLFATGATTQEENKAISVETFLGENKEDFLNSLGSKGYKTRSHKIFCCHEPGGPMYDDAKGVIIGRGVPYQDAREIIAEALRYYPHLSYFGIEYPEASYSTQFNRTVFIGSFVPGNSYMLRANSARAKEIFSEISSQEEFEQLLLRKQAGPRDIVVETIFKDGFDFLYEISLKGYVTKYGAECCLDPNDPLYGSTLGIWVGRKVPYEDAKAIIIKALEAYPQLSYFDFYGSEGDDYPEDFVRTIFVGGFVYEPSREYKKLSSSQAKELFAEVSNQEELEQLLRSAKLRPENEAGVGKRGE